MKRLAWFMLLMVAGHCGATELVIENITNKTGLSNSSVNALFQDSADILWAGTWDGLNAYNSHDFQVFKREIGNRRSISNNIIRNILQQDARHLWVATDFGINRLDLRTRQFTRFFTSDSHPAAIAEQSFLLAKNSHKQLFAAVLNDGLYLFTNNQFRKIQLPHPPDMKAMLFDADDALWTLTRDGHVRKITLTPQAGTLHYRAVARPVPTPWGRNIKSIHRVGKGIAVQNGSNQIALLDKKGVAVQKTNFHATIRDVAAAGEQLYWASEDGVYVSDEQMLRFSKQISGVSALSLCAGTQNIVWVGTDMQGILKIAPAKNNFVPFSAKNIEGMGRSAVRAFVESSANNLWVGTKGNGLYRLRYDEVRNRYSVIAHTDTRKGLINNAVFALTKDNRGFCWVGTDGAGLNYFPPDTHTITPAKLQGSDTIKLASVYAILPDSGQVLWVGTSGGGLFRLTIDYNQSPLRISSFKQYKHQNGNTKSLSSNIVFSIIRAGNYLWVATRGGGINRFDPRTEQFEAFRYANSKKPTISSDDVLCLFRDNAGDIWAGTGLGLNNISLDTDNNPSFRSFVETDGLPNNTIHGILPDKQGNLWISTNRGLAKLLRKEEKIISYLVEDGLQDNEFADGAYYASPYTDLIYFGGINGFNAFNPRTIVHSDFMPKLWLDAFFVDNIQNAVNDYITTEHSKEILTLSYRNKSFGFRFVSVDFGSEAKSELSYMLEGHQTEWVELGRSNTLIFTNVPPGKYVLKVRNSNSFKQWNNNVYTLAIRILPPWWANRWAYLLYLTLAIFTIYLSLKIRQNQKSIRQQMEQKEAEKQQNEAIHQAKLRFFTNIAHEFSNSLTLIYGPSEKLQTLFPDHSTEKKYINIIKSNAERMHRLIRQLMEFRKAETGHLKLQITHVDVGEMLTYILDHFVEMLEQKHIAYSIHLEPETIHCNTDREALEKIIFNLISNAVKYTPDNHRIDILATMPANSLRLQITNTGTGIKEEQKDTLFNRFEVLNQLETQIRTGSLVRNGIGLALCKSIVDVLGGKITVDSDGHSFTTFDVNIPSKPNTDDPTHTLDDSHTTTATPQPSIRWHEDNSPYPQPIPPRTTSKEKRLLIVDDEKEIRFLLADYFSDKYNVVEATNGSEAWRRIEEQTPDAIISDIIMPEMSGTELVQRLKTDNYLKKIPVILLSTRNSTESHVESLDMGADAYVNKPFSIRHLEAVLNNLIKRNKMMADFVNSPYAGLEQYEGQTIPKEDKQLILKIDQTITNNIGNEELSIDFIASELAISKMQLYRKIKQITRLTPTEYIRNIRLNEAEKQLKTTNHTVQEIMYACGFNNKAYFYREFAKKFHQTPKEYRNNAK